VSSTPPTAPPAPPLDGSAPLRRPDRFGETVFSEITALAQAHGAVNLGQGFPDFDPPAFVLEAAQRAAAGVQQQYARGAGTLELCRQVAADAELGLGRTIDPEREVTITVGATEALFAAIMALVEPGEEVLLLEPFYDAYPADVAIAGGRCRYVPLRPGSDGRWDLDLDELAAAMHDQTRLLLLNTPHNPTGKIFDADELAAIAELCCRHDVLVICDEVYEQLLFDGQRHLRLASLPGMWERTLTISSAGKTFSVTGWKIGWVIANPRLSLAVRRIHQWIPFAVATPLQLAVAEALGRAPELGYYDQLRELYTGKRDRLVSALSAAGLRPLTPQGTYFVIADVTAHAVDAGLADDVAFCRWLATEVGVAAIPPSAFYCAEHASMAHRLARFCFCKQDSSLDEAAARLAKLG
jgi:N-succinyldiaminopimelate aminotransferase